MSDLQAIFEAELERRIPGPEWGTSVREVFLNLCDLTRDTVASGNTIFICGNGGSAAQAQHFAAELVGRFKRERQGIPAVALTPGDILIGLSTSGTSPNVVRAARWAREQGYATAALTGAGGGDLAGTTDICVSVPATETDIIQEYHLTLIHILAEVAERTVAGTQ